MDISTRRFHVKSDGFGGVTVRDMNAPYHPKTVSASDMPSAHQAALMTEKEYDAHIVALIYGE